MFCPLLEKDIFIEIVYIVSSCPIKQRSFRSLIFFRLSLVFFFCVFFLGGVFLSCLVVFCWVFLVLFLFRWGFLLFFVVVVFFASSGGIEVFLA